MFKITKGRGFHLIFKNGVTLSTQFGYGNYCDNYEKIINHIEDTMNYKNWESNNCEVAIWDTNKKWITDELLNCDCPVKGYIKIDEWLEIVEKCKNYKRRDL